MKKINLPLTILTFIIITFVGYFGVIRNTVEKDLNSTKNQYQQISKDITYWKSIKAKYEDSLLSNEQARLLIPSTYEGDTTWANYASELLLDTSIDYPSFSSITIINTEQYSILIPDAFEVRINVSVDVANQPDIIDIIDATYTFSPLILIRDFKVSTTKLEISFIGFYK